MYFSGEVSRDLMLVNRPPNIVSVTTRSVLLPHRATVTEAASHHVAQFSTEEQLSAEDQVATQWSEDVLSADVLFGERAGSYSTTIGRITSVISDTVQAPGTVQEAVMVAGIARSS